MTNHGTGLGPAPSASTPGPRPRPRRKSGAIALGISLALFVAGAASLPKAFSGDLEPASAQSTATAAPSTASTAPSAAPPPSSAPPARDTGAPLDPETTALVAQGATVEAPRLQPAFATKAADLLATLPIKGRAPKTGYDRALFGQAWADVDRNGCDTRNDILGRDLTGITFTNSVPCKVQSGMLADPYTGTSISFLRGSGTSSKVQVDHVVALSDAWQKGAQQLTTEQRTAFANDPLNLQATDGPTNQKKGDGDAATWLPPNKGFRCEYVARQISVKATYGLWVTQAEHNAMAAILASCADQLAPTRQAPAAPAPAPAQAEQAPIAAAP
ncbi:HNH endonuclease family protein, partial [Pseudarthrobacter sp. NKDBFgelt]|uniref:HNH endonuclease family protein n=1 Tax=Pseudarthrobacter sp. NKDBFgelt TaxID=3384443 RepID=UPI0038D516FA